MPGCDQGHLVSTYLDGELKAAEAARFQAHLANCPTCQEAISEIRYVDEALREQSMLRRSRFSDCSESIADSVQRELTHSGEFSRARRSTWFRQHHRQLRVTVVGVLVLAVMTVAAILLFSGDRAPATNAAVNELPQVRQLQQSDLSSVLIEAEALLSKLQRDAAVPGAARRLREEAVNGGIRERLLVAESNTLGQADESVASLKIALTHMVNLPDDNIERRSRQLAAALRDSRLLARMANLPQHETATGNGGASLGGLRSDEALLAQLSGNYQQVIGLFQQRVEMTRDEATKAEALFYIGQSQSAGGMYVEAAETMLKFVERYPDHRLADDALFAAADNHRLSGAGQRGDDLYGKLRMEYGDSPLATVALLHQGRESEEQGNFAVALRLYELVQKSAKKSPGLADEAEARRRFIVENRDADFTALRHYRQAEVLSRDSRQWTEAFAKLVRLANSYRRQPIGDDALLLLTRMHLAQSDFSAAEQSFRRLMELPPVNLSRSDVREIALPAVGWLLGDAAAAIGGGRRVFVELSGYSAAEVVKSPLEKPQSWQLAFVSPSGSGTSGRQLRLNVTYTLTKPGPTCSHPNLGLVRNVSIETPNPLLREEIERILTVVDEALAVLDRAAGDRHVPDPATKP